MLDSFIQRENKIFDILGAFSGLDYILIGGYAVSTFKHRFSVDADIVIKRKDLPDFIRILTESGFEETISKKLENSYSTEFKRFEKSKGLTVSVDLLIDGVGIRQTGRVIPFGKLKENSEFAVVIGFEKEIKVKIPKREMLMAMKLHAGRLTDLRDVAALSEKFDPEAVKGFIGDSKYAKENVDKLISLLEDKGFMDSFKGVFMEKKFMPNVRLLKMLGS